MCYIHTREYYLTVKENAIIPTAAIWNDLEIIIISQSKSERERQIPNDIIYA